jgi:Flp pilus assembly protein TadG
MAEAGWWRRIARLAAERRGATAIEYCLILLPFVVLILANIETAVMMFTSQMVQGGIIVAAREIRTGQITSPQTGVCPPSGTAATVPAAFSNAVCNNMFGMVSCSSLTYDVQSYASFATANTTWSPAFDAQGNPINNCFDTGGSSAIVAVRVAYTYTYLTPGLNLLIGSASNPVSFLYTVIIQNEPF